MSILRWLSIPYIRWDLLFTLICPSLLYDWEDIHNTRTMDNGKGSIAHCWADSQRLQKFHLALFALENVLLCIPLAILRIGLAERKVVMAGKGFALLPLETNSLYTIDCILFSSLAFNVIFLPALLHLLALIYIKSGHLWSRVLRTHVAIFPWERL